MSLALVSLAFAGAASAQSLAGVNARLVRPLDSQSATAGQAVAVKLDASVKTTDGVKLPKGTQLIGKVAAVTASQNGGPASVSVVFTSAQLKGGKQIPVKATLLAAYPASANTDAESADQSIVAVPEHVNSDHTVDQEPGALPGITLTAAVKDPTSGTFAKTAGNFKLSAGTFLQVGVAPAASTGATSAAE
ncbi:MAG TPA: hypothetical protein VHX60_18060 [Acidobacteriaceae bacterium]|nr:hypothetical protein [Acidobacteriaceae bacterium]